MDNPIGAFEHGIDDRERVLLQPRFRAENGGDGARLVAGARQRRVPARIAERLADDEGLRLGPRTGGPAAEFRRAQLAQQAASHGPRPRIVARVRFIPRRVEQLPGVGRRCLVQLQQQFTGAGQERLEFDRHEQLEQAAADLLIAVAVVGADAHELVDELALGRLAAHLAARPPRVERELDHGAVFVAMALHGDEIVPRAAVPRVGRPEQSTLAGRDLGRQLEAFRIALRQDIQRLVRLAGAIQEQLDQLQVGHHRPFDRRQPLVGVAHAGRDGLGGGPDAHPAAAAADHRGGQFEAGRTAGMAFAHALGIGQGGLPHRFTELGGAQLAFFAESDHDHGLGPRQHEGVVRVAAGVDEHLLRSDGGGIQAGAERFRHRAIQQAIHGILTAGQFERLVMPQHERRPDEFQIPVHHRDPQPRTGRPARRRRARVTDGEYVARGCGRLRLAQRPSGPAGGHPRRTRRAVPGSPDPFSGLRQGIELGGLAARQELQIPPERVFGVGQIAVGRIDFPGPQAGKAGVRVRHAAVAAPTHVQVFDAVVRDTDPGGGPTRPADDQHQFGRVRAEGFLLRIQTFAEIDRLVQHRLRRHPPLVGLELQLVLVPPAALLDPLAHAFEIGVRQLLPARRLVQTQRPVEQARLQLQQTGHFGNDLARAAIVEQGADPRQ